MQEPHRRTPAIAAFAIEEVESVNGSALVSQHAASPSRRRGGRTDAAPYRNGASSHHIRTCSLDGRSMASPALHWNAFANAGTLPSVPVMRSCGGA